MGKENELAFNLKMKALPVGGSKMIHGYYWLGLNDEHYIKHKISEGRASWLVDTQIIIDTLRPRNCTGKSDKQEWKLIDIKD
jgi:hypothetical protein